MAKKIRGTSIRFTSSSHSLRLKLISSLKLF